MKIMKAQRSSLLAVLSVVPAVLLGLWALFGGKQHPAYAWPGGEFPHATVKVWDTAVPIPPSLSLGMTPGESVEDPTGSTGHGTGFPTIVTVYANGTHPLGPSGLSYWNPDGNVFAWYGKTLGFPSGVDINRGGLVQPGGPFGTSFGPGDVWVGGEQLELVYVHMAGTNFFRTYGAANELGPPPPPPGSPPTRAWGIEVDETTGFIYVAEPEQGRIARLDPRPVSLAPPSAPTKIWLIAGNPAYITLDSTGRPYVTLSASDAILRVNPDDTATFWLVPNLPGRIAPSFRRVPHVGAQLGVPGDNANGIITADANNNIWFLETNSNEVGRLSGGPDGILGTADDEICEFTKPGLLNPQQIAATGSGNLLQAYFTEGDGNSVSVLTQLEADLALPPTRVCTTVSPETLMAPDLVVFEAATTFFDEEIQPLRTVIVPTVHEVAGLDGSASGMTTTAEGQPIPPILRFSPMPNPLLSYEGTPIGDAGNGFPSGLTGVYDSKRIAGAYLKGNKHFEVQSGAIIAPPSPPQDGHQPPPDGLPGRMTGGGRVFMADGRRVTHGFVLQCQPGQKADDDDDDQKNVLQVNWEEGNRFHLKTVTSASCSDDPTIEPTPAAGFDTHTGTGVGRYNGVSGATVEWTLTDHGQPGTEDTARIVITDASGNTVLAVEGKLKKGNHKAHKASGGDD